MKTYISPLSSRESCFTDWQIEKIRSGLLGMLRKESVDGIFDSVFLLAYDIEDSKGSNEDPEKGSKVDWPVPEGEKPDFHFDLKQERLRQFLDGRPLKEATIYLPILKKYLVREEVLTEEEFARPMNDAEIASNKARWEKLTKLQTGARRSELGQLQEVIFDAGRESIWKRNLFGSKKP